MLLDSVPMKDRKLRITEKDFLLANRRASRAEEIERHGKQISMRKLTHKSKKVYDRNRMNLSFAIICTKKSRSVALADDRA